MSAVIPRRLTGSIVLFSTSLPLARATVTPYPPVNHGRNISFQGLLLLRSAYWTTTASDTNGYSATNIKIVNRKQQYHEDATTLLATAGTSWSRTDSP